jgi:hypothetical protein
MCSGGDIPLLKDMRRNGGRNRNKLDGLRHLNFRLFGLRMIDSLAHTNALAALFLVKRQTTEGPPHATTTNR